MISSSLFEVTFYVYVLALVANIVALVSKRDGVERASFWLFALGFTAHTVALLIRWGEAGNVEVAAFQQAEGRILEGWEWFEVWASHPPWTNLFESLVCFGWGMSAVSVYGMHKFNIRILSLFAITLSLVVMGAASLLVEQSITPLVPALQSKWIHLHVSMATISYPAFGLAAVLGLFYLVKAGVPNAHFALVIAITSFLVVLLVGGASLVTEGEYGLTLVGLHNGNTYSLTYGAMDAAGNAIVQNEKLRWSLAGVGPALGLSVLLFAVVPFIWFFGRRQAGGREKLLNIALGVGFAALSLALVIIIARVVIGGEISLSQADLLTLVAPRHLGPDGLTLVASASLHGPAPYFLSLAGNPFEFMLLVTVWLFLAFYFLLVLRREWLTGELPNLERLDDLSYKIILFAFPFLTLLIITGAVWAYYAWGRYWGWDPKETWSLVTWIVYSIYLHVRFTHGWEGKYPAIIALVGFAVVIFTYLGVNILLSGLHSYA